MNNAGFVKGVERIGDIADADIEAMFATNVFGLISLTQLFVRGTSLSRLLPPVCSHAPPTEFKKRNSGHVINLGSVAGREPYVGGGIYCATKHAVRSFTGSLLREVVETPIRVTEIQPGQYLDLTDHDLYLSTRGCRYG